MATKMESSSGTQTAIDTNQVYTGYATIKASAESNLTALAIGIKKEPEDAKINLPPENDDIFDEVDGPEYVDASYEGLAEVDGVEHFVCESLSPRREFLK